MSDGEKETSLYTETQQKRNDHIFLLLLFCNLYISILNSSDTQAGNVGKAFIFIAPLASSQKAGCNICDRAATWRVAFGVCLKHKRILKRVQLNESCSCYFCIQKDLLNNIYILDSMIAGSHTRELLVFCFTIHCILHTVQAYRTVSIS